MDLLGSLGCGKTTLLRVFYLDDVRENMFVRVVLDVIECEKCV